MPRRPSMGPRAKAESRKRTAEEARRKTSAAKKVEARLLERVRHNDNEEGQEEDPPRKRQFSHADFERMREIPGDGGADRMFQDNVNLLKFLDFAAF